ncbi:HET-domain-containing protein, partial [Hyaloscypha variabilis F]
MSIPHDKLDRTKNEIRLISFHRNNTSPLQISLKTVSKDENPRYHCLSYVWGDPTPIWPIVVDDAQVLIAKNLGEALQRVADEKDVEFLWVDALCINQEDEEEKMHQVHMMNNIYSDAVAVLAWLGPEADGSGDVMDEISRDEHTELVSACVHSPFLNLTNEETRALKLFLARPWFHRAWTFQESVLATSAQIHCGSYLFSKKMIYETIYRNLDVSSDARSAEPGSTDYRRLSKTLSVRESWLTYDFSIAELLMSRRGSQCKDPLDLVYSLLGVAIDISGIEPDYTKGVQEVFVAITRHIITTTQNLSILNEVNTERFDDSLPSWVPDWRERKLETAFSKLCGHDTVFRGTLRDFELNTVDDAIRFRVQGRYLDVVQYQVDADDVDAIIDLFNGRVRMKHSLYDDAKELVLIQTMALGARHCPKSLCDKIESGDFDHA